MELNVLYEADLRNFLRGMALTAAIGAGPIYAGAKRLATNQPAANTPSVAVPSGHASDKDKNKKTDAFVARVLFAETAGVTDEERKLVASVIKNRIGNPAFGGGKDMRGVVSVKNAFSAIGDSNNKNWAKSANPAKMTPREQEIYKQCLELSSGNFTATKGPSGRPIVYYHDKSISKPAGWDNKYWKTTLEFDTQHFKFYSVEKVKPKPVTSKAKLTKPTATRPAAKKR